MLNRMYDDFRCLDCSRRFQKSELREWRGMSGGHRTGCPGCGRDNFMLLNNLVR